MQAGRTGLNGKGHLIVQVSFQWKIPDFLLKNPDFLFRNPDFLLKNLDVMNDQTGGLGDSFETQSQLVSMQPQDYMQNRADDVEQVESTYSSTKQRTTCRFLIMGFCGCLGGVLFFHYRLWV